MFNQALIGHKFQQIRFTLLDDQLREVDTLDIHSQILLSTTNLPMLP